MVRLSTLSVCAVSMVVSTNMLQTSASAQSPYATSVISYDPGTTPATTFGGDPYTDPLTALGQPERFTGDGTPFGAAVSMFSPPFLTSELVSIGEGGHLTLQFDRAITDDPSHPFGQDLILFTNAGFIDSDFPNGTLGIPASTFGNEDAIVEVSGDGVNFFPVSHNLAGGLFPTQGYLDIGPFSPTPGAVNSSFVTPMDPALTLSDFDGLTYAQALARYGNSGGGTPIDIASTGLASVNYVRISILDDANANTGLNFELDAISVVPEPATWLLALGICPLVCRRSRRRSQYA